MSDPYGVPTGYVPRVTPRPAPVDPVEEAIEQYLIMQKKAKALDLAIENFKNAGRKKDAEYLVSLIGA